VSALHYPYPSNNTGRIWLTLRLIMKSYVLPMCYDPRPQLEQEAAIAAPSATGFAAFR
jgi:hypothetical protein